MKKTVYPSLITKVITISNKGLLFTSLILLSFLSYSQTTVTFTTPGATTWTVPDCVSSITVQVWGGGGGGGGSISILRNSSDGEACSGAGGGGGGGYTSQTFAVTSGQVYNLVVGAAGTAGTPGAGTWNGGITTPPGVGGTGGTSSFMNFGINLVATGGIGGNGAGAYNNNNPPDVNAVGTGGAGGVGSGGTVFYNGGSGAAGYILWTGTDKSGGGGGAAGPGGPGGNAPAGNSYGIIDNNPGGLGSAPGGTGGNSRMNNLPSNTSKNGGNGNLIGAGGGGGLNHKDGYGAVSASGGAGARGEIRITYSSPVLPATPTINSTAPTCSAAGSSTISNYNAAYTYNFTPAGPTVGAGGVISGMVVGTNYTVTANNGSCNSSATANFSNAPALTTPTTPTLSSTAPTCSAAGSSTISNYNAALTYIFSPAGPTVGAGGVISGMVVGTTYQVTASNGSCSSSNSVDFSNAAILPSPATPTINSTAPTCSAAGSSTISNYNAALTYNFTPAGPTVGAGGVISGMVVGTNYTVTTNNGSCNSSATANFSNAPMLTTPTTPTLSSTAPTCSAAGSSTISNYNAALTYIFSPAGPTVGAGGVISGMVVGTTYQVTASNGSCSSSNSVDFSNAAILPSPATPNINSTAPICSAAGSSTISNYNAALTYNFTPAGPTVGAGGVISGMVVGTNYTVTANNGSCNSSATANFSNADMLPFPVVTASSAAVCENGVITLTPTTGGTWVSNNTAVATITAAGVVTIISNGSVDFTFTATNTCTATTPTVLVNPGDNSSFSYTSNTHCLTGTNPIATVTGTAGGTFTITAPGVINATTGEVDLGASGLGTFTVYYNTAAAGNPCPSIDSTIINITSAPSATFSYNTAQACQDATAPILSFGVGASAGVFSSTPIGLNLNPSTGAITLPSAPGVYTVYNTIAASGGCAAALDSTTIEILPLDNATFNYATGGNYCLTGTNPIATVTGTVGGTFTITAPGVINATTGEVDLSASGLGTFIIYYNTPSGNACPQLDSTTINIVDAPSAAFTYATPFCQDNGTALPTFVGNNFAGTFSANPAGVVFVSTSTGEINLTSSTAGTYTIYNNLAASGGCAAALDSFVVTINPSFNLLEIVSVCSGGNYTFPDGTTQTNITIPTTYTSNLTTSLGCDSIVETTVNVNPTYFNQESTNICSGGSFTFPDGTTQTNITTQVVYTSTLTTTFGCDSIIETTVNIAPQSTIAADPVAPICFGENLILTATGSGNGTVTWYSDAAGTNVIGTGSTFNATTQVSTTGLYTFYVNETGTCPSPLTAVNVVVGGVTAAITATPTSGFMPLTVSFGNNSSTGPTVSYTWVFGDGTANSNQFEPTHTYTNLGNYSAVLIVTDGVCFDTATVVIEVVGQSTILIPNVFTPNSDGSNDVFTVDGTNLESVEGQIFNRWGQKLYEWNGVKGSWDGRTQAGTEVPDGTYFYIINAKGMDGEEYFKTGACTLIR